MLPMSVKRGDIIEVKVHDLASSGNGVARLDDGMAVFVAGAIPGSRVKASVQKVKKRFAEAIMAEVVEYSPQAAKPQCPHFPECGGCLLQHMDPAAQLACKQQWVTAALERIGGLSGFAVKDPIASPSPWHYRNKMEFVFGTDEGRTTLGLRSRVDGKVMDVPECRICSETTARVYRAALDAIPRLGRVAYNPKTAKGYLRRLVVRHHQSGVMVHLITATARDHGPADKLGKLLTAGFPEITSFVHSTRKTRRDLAFGERIVQVIGDDSVVETLPLTGVDVRYRISPNAFFQPNTATAAKMYDAVREAAGLTGSETVMDLYCGTGGLALAMADKADRVLGFELAPESVKDAMDNAELNGLNNCDFRAGSLDQGLGNMRDLPTPDVVVTDPPRSGMHESIVRAILDLSPRTVVAVSCDPATLARDLGRLSSGYALESVRTVDQFPHTAHVEAVAVLRRK